MRRHLGIQSFRQPRLRLQQIVPSVQIQPELRLHPKIAAKTQGRIGADRPLALNDLTDSTLRNADVLGQAILADFHGHKKFFEQDLAGIDRWDVVLLGHWLAPSGNSQSRCRRRRRQVTRNKCTIGRLPACRVVLFAQLCAFRADLTVDSQSIQLSNGLGQCKPTRGDALNVLRNSAGELSLEISLGLTVTAELSRDDCLDSPFTQKPVSESAPIGTAVPVPQ